MATLVTVFLASLLGSLHCAGMCGPLVAFAVGATETQTNRGRLLLQLTYHGGRLATYALVGAICGLLGAVIDFGGSLIGLNRFAAVLAGAMMVGVGLLSLARYAGMRLPRFSLPGPLDRAIAVGRKAAMGLQPISRALVIGLLTALLPCGWLYAFAVVAAGTGQVLFGAAVMTAFWLGTVPILASLGVGVQTLAGTLGRRIPSAMALVIVALGLYTIIARPAISVEDIRPAVERLTDTDPDELLESIQSTELPCCHSHVDQTSE